MYVCMCVCVYACMYVSMTVCMYVCKRPYVNATHRNTRDQVPWDIVGLLLIEGEQCVLYTLRAFEEPEGRKRRSGSKAMKLTPTLALSHWWETLEQGCTKK